MIANRPIVELIRERFSCRSYLDEPIAADKQSGLRNLMKTLTVGPFGTPLRFELIAGEAHDPKELRGLGTYGFIKGASGFILGTVSPGIRDMEDHGYRLEQIVLFATALGLGTCWLGGTFSRSSFAKKITVGPEDRMPTVVALGLIAQEVQARRTLVRQFVGADKRLPWEKLFFDRQFGVPLAREQAGRYAQVLDMLRLGPSASNKQPWRVIQSGQFFHFYLQRTWGYRGSFKIFGVEDMQRVDMGIAMCHFELTAQELGLSGHWQLQEPPIDKPDLTEYSVSWVAQGVE